MLTLFKALGRKERAWREQEIEEYVIYTLGEEASAGPSTAPMDLDAPDSHDDHPEDWMDEEVIQAFDDVHTGRTRLEISHAGEESGRMIGEMAVGISGDFGQQRRRRRDDRHRKARVEVMTMAFRGQIEEMVNAYAHFLATRGASGLNDLGVETPEGVCESTQKVTTLDAFGTFL